MRVRVVGDLPQRSQIFNATIEEAYYRLELDGRYSYLQESDCVEIENSRILSDVFPFIPEEEYAHQLRNFQVMAFYQFYQYGEDNWKEFPGKFHGWQSRVAEWAELNNGCYVGFSPTSYHEKYPVYTLNPTSRPSTPKIRYKSRP